MNNKQSVLQRFMHSLVLSAALVGLSLPARAQQAPVDERPLLLAALVDDELRPQRRPLDPQGTERERTGWAFYVDNDAFAPGNTDRDYTGGFSVTYSGAGARSLPLSLDPALAAIDKALGLEAPGRMLTLHSMEWGFTAFTPEDVSVAAPQADDRPYASLVYSSNSRQHVDAGRGQTTISTLSIGLLGLDLAADVQNRLHDAAGFETTKGWDNQISDGGEPTLRYGLSRQWLLAGNYAAGRLNFEVQSMTKLNFGYLTDLGFGISARVGRLRSPWWSHNPQLSEYAEKSAPLANGISPWARSESYLWGGLAVRYRLYNVFLQGQFRDSAVAYDWNQLRHEVVEAWLGYTHEFDEGLRLSYVLRGQTAEIRDGPASRSAVWGGLILSQAL